MRRTFSRTRFRCRLAAGSGPGCLRHSAPMGSLVRDQPAFRPLDGKAYSRPRGDLLSPPTASEWD